MMLEIVGLHTLETLLKITSNKVFKEQCVPN